MSDEPVQNGNHNNDLSRKIASDINAFASRAYRVEVILVGIGVLLIAVGLSFIGWNGWRDRAQGERLVRAADRIISCTTENQACYEQQQTRSNFVITDIVLKLIQENYTTQCLLLDLPGQRTTEGVDDCRAKAGVRVEAERAEIRKRLEELARKANEAADQGDQGGP